VIILQTLCATFALHQHASTMPQDDTIEAEEINIDLPDFSVEFDLSCFDIPGTETRRNKVLDAKAVQTRPRTGGQVRQRRHPGQRVKARTRRKSKCDRRRDFHIWGFHRSVHHHPQHQGHDVGVSWGKKEGKWRAYIQKNKVWEHPGFFTDKKAAKQAYINRSNELGIINRYAESN